MADPRKASYALRFIAGKYKGGEFPLRPNREIIIGRNSEYDMVLHEDMVSRRHAKLITLHGKIVLQDLKSTNGTFVNGEKITVARLQVGDRVLVGTSLMQLMEMESTDQTLGIDETPATAAPPAAAPSHPPALAGVATAPPGVGEFQPQSSGLPMGLDPNAPVPMSTIAAPQQLRENLSPTDVSLAPMTPEPGPGPTVPPGPVTPEPIPAAQGHPELPGLKEAMRGRFPDDDITLADLVDLFHAGRRNGVLLVSSEAGWQQEARVFFREGHLYYATLVSRSTDGVEHRPSQPIKAFYRALTWQEGDFRFLTGDQLPRFEGEIEDGTRNLLLEGVRQWDELRKFSRHLPGLGAQLKLTIPLTPLLSELSAETLDSLQVVLNHGQVVRILNASDASDLETWQDLLYLMQNGYLS